MSWSDPKDLPKTYKENLKIIEESDIDSKEFKEAYETVERMKIGNYKKENLPYRCTYFLSKKDYSYLKKDVEVVVFDYIPSDIMSMEKLF